MLSRHGPAVLEALNDKNMSLLWRHNVHDSVSNHQFHDCLLNLLFGRRSKKTSKLRVSGLCGGIHRSPVNSPPQRTSNADNVPIRWRHHVSADSKFAPSQLEASLQSNAISLAGRKPRISERRRYKITLGANLESTLHFPTCHEIWKQRCLCMNFVVIITDIVVPNNDGTPSFRAWKSTVKPGAPNPKT